MTAPGTSSAVDDSALASALAMAAADGRTLDGSMFADGCAWAGVGT
jgi:hypothetical protein